MGLQYVHSKNFVHCDIKPSNVLISATSANNNSNNSNQNNPQATVQLKISEFGLCKPASLNGSRSLGGSRGTRNYLAPELLRLVVSSSANSRPLRSSQSTSQSDVFSLGCVFFYWISAGVRHPFGSSGGVARRQDLDANILNGLTNFVGFEQHPALNLIGQMIERDAESRPQMADVVQSINQTIF